jgi:hypothetical protein
MTRCATRALLKTVLFCLSLSCLLPGCKLLKDDEGLTAGAGHPPHLLSEALASRFKEAHIKKYSVLSDSSGPVLAYFAEFTSEGRHYIARVLPGRGLVAWQKFLRAEEIPAAVRDSVHTGEGASNIRSAGEIRLRDEAGSERLAAYRILCRRSDISWSTWILNPDGTILREGRTRLEVDSLLRTDLE